MTNILKNCGNFSMRVLQGMIAYGEEKEKGRGKREAMETEGIKDGYATKEGDISMGGFLYIEAAKEASKSGKKLVGMTTAEKKILAYKIAARHTEKFGLAGSEYYCHWLERIEKFAQHNRLKFPERQNRENNYDYSRRLRDWTLTQPENWPELQKAAGTHLMLSPEPKLWGALRAAGVEERTFLKKVLAETMKDFSDWRRQVYGPGHGIGWVAGTHVNDNGADQHPHIHLVVLKRDEAGKEVDMSVSRLKGRKSNRTDPDPMETLKARFSKNMNREFERATGLKPEQVSAAQKPNGQELSQKDASQEAETSSNPNWTFWEEPKEKSSSPNLSRLGRGLRAASRIMFPYFPKNSFGGDLGAMLRIMSAIQQMNQASFPSSLPSLNYFQKRVRNTFNPIPEPGIQPGD